MIIKRPFRWDFLFIALSLVALVAAAVFYFRLPEPVSTGVTVPSPDTTDMQTLVARAIEEARNDVITNPTSARAWGVYGATLDAHHLYNAAVPAYRRARQLDPDEFNWAYLLAVAEDFRGGEPEAVLDAFAGAAQLNDSFPPLFYRYGDALVRQGRLEEARDAFARAVELDDGLAAAHRSLGQVLMNLGDNEDALKHLRRASELLPRDSISLESLARALQLTGDTVAAREALERAQDATPVLAIPDPVRYEVEELGVTAKVLNRRYQVYVSGGEHQKAVEVLLLLIEEFPDVGQYRLALGDSYLELGRADEARQAYAQAMTGGEDAPEVYLRFGQMLERRNDTPGAEAQYRAGLEQFPDSGPLYGRLARVLAMQGQFDKAALAFPKAAELAPDDPEIQHNWGTLFMNLGNFDAATERFNEALRLNPDSADTLYNLGRTRENLGDMDGASEFYLRAARVNPEHAAAQRLRELKDQS